MWFISTFVPDAATSWEILSVYMIISVLNITYFFGTIFFVLFSYYYFYFFVLFELSLPITACPSPIILHIYNITHRLRVLGFRGRSANKMGAIKGAKFGGPIRTRCFLRGTNPQKGG